MAIILPIGGSYSFWQVALRERHAALALSSMTDVAGLSSRAVQ
jgi:hypothetical protein